MAYSQEVQEVKEKVQEAINLKRQLWDVLREIEILIGRDIDDFESRLEYSAVWDADITIDDLNEILREGE
jgi:hypothetical protein